jgi:signal transduction histidine kinase
MLAGEQWQREMVDRTKSGEAIVLAQTISPISDANGEIQQFVVIARDVTERTNHQTRLEEQRDDLELLNQVLRHDIRNDLQLVTAYAELLEDHVDEAGRAYLEKVRESAENAVALTSTAKEMAEVMLQTTAENTPVGLAATLNRQLEEVRDSYTEAVISVDGHVPTVTVLANDLLSSVFRNLLKNAIQHNDKPVPTVTVEATADESAGTVTVRIADNGPGVSDEQRSELFGKGAKGLDSAGTGIGLYLVHSLVASYDGEVWYEDNDPEGSVFVVELPTVGDSGSTE